MRPFKQVSIHIILLIRLEMRIIQLLLISLFLTVNGFAQVIKVMEPVRFLALGDSYTIGQSVTVNNRWPNQFVAELGRQGYNVEELRIIAQTGWTTASLQNAINQQMPLNGYTLVTLLIGVNNQFQGGSIDTYTVQFEELLQQAIFLAGNNPQHVFVLSIPDYAYTPYGNGNPLISAEIDLFNGVNRFITSTYNIRYIDITPISRLGLSNPYLIADDGLHPSGDMYRLWVEEIVKYIEKEVGYSENPPSNEEINVSVYGRQIVLRSTVGIKEFRVFNMAGNEVRRESGSGLSQTVINLADLPGGIYLLRLLAEDNRVYSAKLILI
jgi:lysophospholipase L1-like esterase